ncbi:MAG: isoleucine--tRNA ligase [Sulfolobales archaeon]|nr:isoleucine--tRNA ligase [Sulfolobales archaeon]
MRLSIFSGSTIDLPPLDVRKIEDEVRKYWRERSVPQKWRTLSGKKIFSFLEGPPTANGYPHVGHLRGRIYKDFALRYHKILGYDVWAQGGWDEQGLPVEVEVEKKLGIRTKREIFERVGLEKFVEECNKLVDYYLTYWKLYATELVGLWLDLENAYETRRSRYLEYVWYLVKRAWERGLLYEGYRVLPFCPRCETALSDAEVDMGYEERESPSIYVKLKIEGRDGDYLLVWTTTPWTLIDNEAVAVRSDAEYCLLDLGSERWFVAKQLVERVGAELGISSWRCVEELKGAELRGLRYEHPLLNEVPLHRDHANGHVVLDAGFVSLEEGTGLVHIAPGHGPEDFELGVQHGLPVTSTVGIDGVFDEGAGLFKGLSVSEASELVINVLSKKKLLVRSGRVVHRYPHCWRCGTPLIYRADRQWFIAMSRLRSKLLEALNSVEIFPRVHRSRFESWLANVKDWTISRSRIWGTPLPIWRCADDPSKVLVIGSLDELKRYASSLPSVDEDRLAHRPWIDMVELKTPDCSRWVREPFVVDVWIDSGVAWIASVDGLRNRDLFSKLFPYSFITEAIDQTRGWFYSLIATSVIDVDAAPYAQVLIQGHVLDKYGRKMSKHLGNVVYAEEALKKFGADPLRLYLLYRYPPGDSFMFDPEEVRKVSFGALNIVWNVFRFAAMYMDLDLFNPRKHRLENYENRLSVEDRWILSRINTVAREFTDYLSRYEVHKAVQLLVDFAVNDLSRTYLKLVRPRVWSEESDDRFVVYATLYYTLKRLLKLFSPAVPHISEALWLYFVKHFEPEELESVHLAKLDEVDEGRVEPYIEESFRAALKIVEVLAFLRSKLGIKIRYPLREAIVVADEETLKKLDLARSVVSRLSNVKRVELLPVKSKCLEDGYEYVQEGGVTVCLQKVVDRELYAEALAREIIRRIQVMRKEMNLDIAEYVDVAIETDSEDIATSLQVFREYVSKEVRALRLLQESPGEGFYVKTWDIEGFTVRIGLRRAQSSS